VWLQCQTWQAQTYKKKAEATCYIVVEKAEGKKENMIVSKTSCTFHIHDRRLWQPLQICYLHLHAQCLFSLIRWIDFLQWGTGFAINWKGGRKSHDSQLQGRIFLFFYFLCCWRGHSLVRNWVCHKLKGWKEKSWLFLLKLRREKKNL